MKLEIYGQEKEPEKIARFRLAHAASGNLAIHEVNEDGGFVKSILEITPRGIRRVMSCDGGSLPTEASNDHRVCLVT